ncbi:MAG: hypothetical protein R2839_09995 [Thermomicrobiales bacterium]
MSGLFQLGIFHSLGYSNATRSAGSARAPSAMVLLWSTLKQRPTNIQASSQGRRRFDRLASSLAEQSRAARCASSYIWSHAASHDRTGSALLIRNLTEAALARAGGDAALMGGVSLPEEALTNPNWPFAVRSYLLGTGGTLTVDARTGLADESLCGMVHGAIGDDPDAGSD